MCQRPPAASHVGRSVGVETYVVVAGAVDVDGPGPWYDGVTQPAAKPASRISVVVIAFMTIPSR